MKKDGFIDHYYVVEDLDAAPLKVKKYPTYKEAIMAYLVLPMEQKKAFGIQNTNPLPGSLDLIQCIDGKHCLIEDYKHTEGWYDNPAILNIVEQIRSGPLIIQPQHTTECRFITPHYKELFRIPDGENLVLTRLDGNTVTKPCHWIDSYHFAFGNNTYHICEFAETCQSVGATIAPEHPRPGDCTDTYEIYQIHNTRKCGYSFMGYEYAENSIDSKDYTRMYAGMYAPGMDLEDVFSLHNRDDRPFGRSMHSLSVSDIVLVNRKGTHKAYYVDSVGYKEIPGMGEKLWQKSQDRQPTEKKGIVR